MIEPACDPVLNAYCDAQTRACEPRKDLGEPCSAHEECDSRFCDDSQGPGVCAAPEACREEL